MPRVRPLFHPWLVPFAGLLCLATLPVLAQEEAVRPEAAAAAPAAETGEPDTPPLEELDQRLRILERLRELEEEQKAEKAKQAAIVGAGKEGFFLRSADGKYQMRFRGYLHSNAIFADNDQQVPVTDTFFISRARPIFEASLGLFDFRIMPDFGLGRTVLQDAYMDWKFSGFLKLRVGKFKSPFGLERLQSANDIAFVDRALPTNLVPNRDQGLMLHGEIRDALVQYAAGVFNGVVDGGSTDADNDDSKEATGRVFLHPFRRTSMASLRDAGLGVASSYGKNTGTLAAPALPAYRTAGLLNFFTYLSDGTLAGTTVADGRRYRLSPQAYYYLGRFGALAEYVVSHQEVTRNGVSEDLRQISWQATVSFLLTDDKATYNAVSPSRPFDPSAGTWGAFEIVARAGALRVDEEAFPVFADDTRSARVARDWRAGVNWYLTRNFKIMVNYAETRFDGGAASGEDREDEKDLLTRFQIAF